MEQYLGGAILSDPTYFKFTAAQARCFGDPRRFHYHDVSWVRAGGQQTKQPLYGQYVAKNAKALARYVLGVEPGLIIVGGGDAHDEFLAQILPRLGDWRGHVVRAWNPSSNGHFGKEHAWVESRYGEVARLNLLRTLPDAVEHWKLTPEPDDPRDRLVPLER